MITEEDSQRYFAERGYNAWVAEGYQEEARRIADEKSRKNENALYLSTLIIGGLLLGMAYVQQKYNPLFLYAPPANSQVQGIR